VGGAGRPSPPLPGFDACGRHPLADAEVRHALSEIGETVRRGRWREGRPIVKHYKLSRFSSERLLHFVTLLDRDVEIIIRPKAKGRASGVVSVSVA
jgi:hypothetical protein